MIESSALGGTCVNIGCVPKKLMVYGAHFSHDVHGLNPSAAACRSCRTQSRVHA